MVKPTYVVFMFPLLAWAGAHDYYECVDPRGIVVSSVEPCAKGQKQRKVQNDTAPVMVHFEKSGGGAVRLESDRSGNYFGDAKINGVPMRVMVDTGASLVMVSPTAAVRAGLDRRPFRVGWSQTANGRTPVRVLEVDSVELGGNVVRSVLGGVLSRDMGPDIDVLLGMSFLKHFEIHSAGGVMTLQPK